MKRLEWLDALRGVSAIVVVLYHYFYRFDQLYGYETIYTDWIVWGQYGVQCFFIISGFVIFMSIASKVDITRFIISRFSRLIPVYWFSLVITYLVVLYFGLPGREVSSFEFLINFTLLQEFLKVPHVDGVYWTLVVEVTFYAWVAFLVFFRCHDFVYYFLLFFSVFSVLGFFFDIDYGSYVKRLFFLKYIPFFLMGFVIYSFKYSIYPVFFGRNILVFGAIVSLMHLVSLDFFGIVVVVLFLSAMVVFLYNDIEIKIYPPLVWLGTISYPLYLLHQNIGYVIIIQVKDLFGSEILGIFLALFVTVLFSGLVHKYFEKPSIKLIRSTYLKLVKN